MIAMFTTNYYEVLAVSPQASQQTIKQAYRGLVKRFHPDSHCQEADRDRIILINAAYEVLRDPSHRRCYDQQLTQGYVQGSVKRQTRTAKAQSYYQQKQKSQRHPEIDLEQWLQEVYQPVSYLVREIIEPLEVQLDELSADPFDDQLMDGFQSYLEQCREYLEKAHYTFKSQPNPAKVGAIAAKLYYCLNHLGDGLDEFEWFTLNYEESYLHTGHEMFRIANHFHCEAQAVSQVG